MEVLQSWPRQAGERRAESLLSERLKKGGKLIIDVRIEPFRFHDLRHHFASRLI